jgi:hypothetical protein
VTHFGPGFLAGTVATNDAFTKTLLHLDGNTNDTNAGGLAKTWTNHGATFVAGEFGSAASFNGSTWIDTPDSTDFTLGTGDFTIDFWFNVQGGFGTFRRVFGQVDSAGSVQSISANLTTANKWTIVFNAGTTFAGVAAFPSAGWHHFAFVRTSGSYGLFLDGVLDITGPFPTAITDSTDVFAIGRGPAGSSNDFIGLIDEFRLSVGIARWTSNFTPPTSPYAP